MNNELTAALLTIEKCRELSGCPADVDLQDWVKQLAAENVALKAGIREAFEEMESHHDADGLYSYDADGEQMDALIRLCDAQGTISDLLMVETPATDRIVAGIKADGASEFISRLQQCVDEGDFVGDEVAVIVGAIDCGKEFCEQLREGAK
ncbi:hypothetical protein [Klebsiella aerogenes]|uniref:hypothetical protein n=1 Tax=Klebsiella aerogenes TaxID=548 RepID=UPI003A96A1A2